MSGWEEALHKYIAKGEAYASAKAERVKLERVADAVKAEVFLEARAHGETVAEAEAHSKCSPAYRETVGDLVAAIKAEENARTRIDAMRIWFDMVRTDQATKREEMRLAR